MSAAVSPLGSSRRWGDGFVVAPGVFDPYSARIVEKLGFAAVYLGGNALGLHLGVGQPFVTLTDTAAIVQNVRRIVRVPIIVDVGAGFGDAVHAALTMQTLANAGAAALHLDDQIYPKRAHYHRGKGRLADTDIVCGKLRAMAATRGDADVLLIARTDTLRVTRSVDATIARCRAYLAAGADALMILDLEPGGAAPFRKAFPQVPLVWIGGIAEPVPTAAELEEAGFSVAVYPFNTIGAATEAMRAMWSGFAETGRPGLLSKPCAKVVADALEIIDLGRAIEIERNTTEAQA
jgi:methylisocitrate lyase